MRPFLALLLALPALASAPSRAEECERLLAIHARRIEAAYPEMAGSFRVEAPRYYRMFLEIFEELPNMAAAHPNAVYPGVERREVVEKLIATRNEIARKILALRTKMEKEIRKELQTARRDRKKGRDRDPAYLKNLPGWADMLRQMAYRMEVRPDRAKQILQTHQGPYAGQSGNEDHQISALLGTVGAIWAELRVAAIVPNLVAVGGSKAFAISGILPKRPVGNVKVAVRLDFLQNGHDCWGQVFRSVFPVNTGGRTWKSVMGYASALLEQAAKLPKKPGLHFFFENGMSVEAKQRLEALGFVVHGQIVAEPQSPEPPEESHYIDWDADPEE